MRQAMDHHERTRNARKAVAGTAVRSFTRRTPLALNFLSVTARGPSSLREPLRRIAGAATRITV
jgi:hypothetical protein